jgi:hypothetical protein
MTCALPSTAAVIRPSAKKAQPAGRAAIEQAQRCEPEWDGERRVVGARNAADKAHTPGTGRINLVALILLVLLLAIVLGGLGFAIHVLWWIALAVLVLWLIGFLVRVGEGTSRSRWYRW